MAAGMALGIPLGIAMGMGSGIAIGVVSGTRAGRHKAAEDAAAWLRQQGVELTDRGGHAVSVDALLACIAGERTGGEGHAG